MNPEGKPWTPSSIGLVVAGVSLIRARLYFVLLPPPLLPEDVRCMELPAAQLDIIRLRLEVWLTHFFRVMGGFVPATGVLTVTLTSTCLLMAKRAREEAAATETRVAYPRDRWDHTGLFFKMELK